MRMRNRNRPISIRKNLLAVRSSFSSVSKMNQRFITAVIALSLSFILHGYIGQGDTAFTIFRGNNATRMNSRLSLQSSELLQYAAKTGQSKWIEMTGFHQTVITQDGVNITLDCGSLLTGIHSGGNISWSRLSLSNKGQIDTYRDFVSIADGVGHYSLFGTGRSKLSLSTSIRRSAGDTILNSGIFKCQVCSVTKFPVLHSAVSPECSHRNTTLFVVGGPPVIDAGRSTDDPVDQMYKVGTDFCLKRLQSVRLECGLLNSFDKKRGTSSPAFPPPLLTWTLNNNLVYREEINDSHPLINMAFFMTGDNMLLAPGLIHPPPLTIEGNTIQLDLHVFNTSEALNISEVLNAINTSGVLPHAINTSEVLVLLQNHLLEILLGSWTCTQSNVYGSSSATTIITDCSGSNEPSSLSFNISHYIVNESQRSIKVCVHRSGEASQFQVFTLDNEAKESVDYVGINATMNIDLPHKCFQVYIVNDNISEVVESFYLHLESHRPGVNVTIVNQTLTIVIKDDDNTEEEAARCTLDEFLMLPPPSSSSNPAVFLIDTYKQLNKVFNSTATPDGYSRFSATMDDIFNSYTVECDNLVEYIPERYNITALAATFAESVTPHIRGTDLPKARSIYGKLLCYYERAHAQTKPQRVKRGHNIRNVSSCDPTCPSSITTPCHFFNCLTDRELERFFFGNEEFSTACIGFLIDTSGSMREEIASAKRVIRQFLKTQRSSTSCYLLVPFNNWDIVRPSNVRCNPPVNNDAKNVGPIAHAFTSPSFPISVNELMDFYEILNNLSACGGHSGYGEHSLSAMMEALDYTVPANDFKPMDYGSTIVVLTDEGSEKEELEPDIIKKAKDQEVSISFIIPSFLNYYSVYTRIADETGGIVSYEDHSTTWSLLNFIEKHNRTYPGRHKRSTGTLSVSVSRFTYDLMVSIWTMSSNIIRITLPDNTTEIANVEDSVMIYSKSYPRAGDFVFHVSVIQGVSVQQEMALDVNLFFMDRQSTVSSIAPPPACTSGKLALTSSRSSEILSMSLNETDSHGNSQQIPLTKCGNVFKCDYEFNAGSFHYGVHGLDTNRIAFTYDLNKQVVFKPNKNYLLRPLNDTKITVEYSERFSIYFELVNNDLLGSAHFRLSVSHPEGFATTLNPPTVLLHPKETQMIYISAYIRSSRIGGGSKNHFIVYFNNECVTLSASTVVTVNPLPTPTQSTQSTSATNVCGCMNGGTCILTTFLGIPIRRCNCSPGYRGSRCQRRI